MCQTDYTDLVVRMDLSMSEAFAPSFCRRACSPPQHGVGNGKKGGWRVKCIEISGECRPVNQLVLPALVGDEFFAGCHSFRGFKYLY